MVALGYYCFLIFSLFNFSNINYIVKFHSANFNEDFISRKISFNSNSSNIQLTTEVLETSITPIDDDLYAADIKLKLKIINKGITPVLVCKECMSISHIWMSKTQDKLVNKDFELSISQTTIINNKQNSDSASLINLEVLTNSSPLEAEETIRIFVKKNPESKIQGSVKKGNYVLQILLETSMSEEVELKRKFEKCNNLLNEPINSEPITIILQ